MRKITLYIAVSLNGKIARSDGSVDWLDNIPNPDRSDYGYSEFLQSVDTTIQGNNTYQQLINWGIKFPYDGKTNYVLTRSQNLKDNESVKFVSSDHVNFIRKLKNQEGKGIYLIGGGQVNTLLFNEDLLDEIILFIMPIIIPGGKDLFDFLPKEKLMKLVGTKSYPSGVVELKYEL